MSTSHVLVQGIPVPPGQAPGLRKEFSDWATQTPQTSIQVSLFIRALQKFYDIPYDLTLSYFQVSGTQHGHPSSVRPAHSAQQKIYQLMGDVINNNLKFNSDADKQAWINESTKWRLPYWDWALAANKSVVPALFIPASVEIRVPAAADGSQPAPESVPNPLYRYQLKVNGVPKKMGDLPKPYTVDSVTLDDGTVLPWAQCSGTSRWGIKSTKVQDWSDGVNNYEGIVDAINSHNWYGVESGNDLLKHPVSDLVYRLLSNVQTWANFSSTVTNPVSDQIPWEEWISLEYVHNNLHGFIGGDALSNGIGHMQNVPSAAFDPIFYMHHCNIDRLLAIWQILNWDCWFASDASPSSTEPLTPFHHRFDSGKVGYFNSDDSDESNKDYVTRIKVYVEKTYQNTGRVLLNDHNNLYKDITVKDHTYDDYLIDVLYDRYALEGDPYTIHFFLGAVPHSEITAGITNLFKHPRHVGSVYNFSSPMRAVAAGGAPRCANCAKQHDDGLLSMALVPLTIPLYNAAADTNVPDIQHLSPNVVEPYLVNQLSWVAVSTNGTVIPWNRLSRTKIFVLKGKAKHYRDDTRLSDYSDYERMSNVTHGKEAGASHDEY
ncbi:hypothetical protein MMC22_001271 [Lobaria immixta]|nr:hypothetical protein [Lobaria immixta]